MSWGACGIRMLFCSSAGAEMFRGLVCFLKCFVFLIHIELDPAISNNCQPPHEDELSTAELVVMSLSTNAFWVFPCPSVYAQVRNSHYFMLFLSACRGALMQKCLV